MKDMKAIHHFKKALPTGWGISRRVMRVLCLALTLSAGASTAFADWDYKTVLDFFPEHPTSYSYTKPPVEDEPEDPLETKELFRVAIAQDSRTNKSTIPFTIDEAGQLNLAEGVSTNEVQVAWCTLSLDEDSPGTKDYITVGDKKGIPDGALDEEQGTYYFFASYPEGFEKKKGATVTNYLVAFDTRDRDGDEGCPGEPKRVSRYAVRKIANVTSEPKGGSAGTKKTYYVVYVYPIYVPPSSEKDYDTIAQPGCELSADFTTFVTNSWTNTVAISSYTLVDTATGEKTVLTGKELEDYLTPTFSGATIASGSTTVASAQVLSTEEDTTTSASTSGNLTIKVKSPDLIYYTLWTSTSPQADSTWQTWEKFLKEKDLDISDAKAYSKFRVNEGGTEIVLPKVEGEARRFYQLRGASH